MEIDHIYVHTQSKHPSVKLTHAGERFFVVAVNPPRCIGLWIHDTTHFTNWRLLHAYPVPDDAIFDELNLYTHTLKCMEWWEANYNAEV